MIDTENKSEVSEDLRGFAAALYGFGGEAVIAAAILDILANKNKQELQSILGLLTRPQSK